MNKSIILVLALVLLAGCATGPQPLTCEQRMSSAMKDIEPFSVAADRAVWRDEQDNPYIKIVPQPGFRESMMNATTQWEQVRQDCWSEEQRKSAITTPYTHGLH